MAVIGVHKAAAEVRVIVIDGAALVIVQVVLLAAALDFMNLD